MEAIWEILDVDWMGLTNIELRETRQGTLASVLGLVVTFSVLARQCR